MDMMTFIIILILSELFLWVGYVKINQMGGPKVIYHILLRKWRSMKV